MYPWSPLTISRSRTIVNWRGGSVLFLSKYHVQSGENPSPRVWVHGNIRPPPQVNNNYWTEIYLSRVFFLIKCRPIRYYINCVIVRRLEWRIVKERSGLSGLSPSDPEMVGWKVSNRRIIRLNYCTSAKEVMFSSASLSLLVNRIKQSTTQLMFAKFGGKVAHGPWMKRLDFDGNPGHVTLG